MHAAARHKTLWTSCFLTTALLAQPTLAQRQHQASTSPAWIASWATSEQIPEPQNALPAASLTGSTLRQIVHLSAGGSMLRVHLSNAFGSQPLHLTSVHVARPLSTSSSAIDPATDHALTFAGASDVTIPAGAEYISDPVAMPAVPLSNLAVSIYFTTPPAGQTGHPGSRATSYIAPGDLTAAAELPHPQTVEHWYTLSDIDVSSAQPGAFTIIAFGDSITDGHASTTNGNDRWPDILAQRVAAAGELLGAGVVNEGIGGNHMLTDGLGPNALARFDRDVLAPSNARYVILLEGINDLGKIAVDKPGATPEEHQALVHALIASYEQFVERAHAHGLKVFGGTIMPDTGSDYYHPNAANEADRQAVNAWIRTPGHFDAVIDFDKALADPANPTHLLQGYDSGDHLHPSPAGYRAMATAIPLSLFR